MDVLLHPPFWWVAGAVTLAVWLAIAATAAYNLRRIPWLSPAEPGALNDSLISVIVPVRNEERDVAVALRSVLAQEGVRLEVIAVNDHSSDRSAAIPGHFHHIAYQRLSRPVGGIQRRPEQDQYPWYGTHGPRDPKNP